MSVKKFLVCLGADGLKDAVSECKARGFSDSEYASSGEACVHFVKGYIPRTPSPGRHDGNGKSKISTGDQREPYSSKRTLIYSTDNIRTTARQHQKCSFAGTHWSRAVDEGQTAYGPLRPVIRQRPLRFPGNRNILGRRLHRSRGNKVGVSIESAEEYMMQLETLRQQAINSG